MKTSLIAILAGTLALSTVTPSQAQEVIPPRLRADPFPSPFSPHGERQALGRSTDQDHCAAVLEIDFTGLIGSTELLWS